MIWTVILKNGNSFVVNGSTYNLNEEVSKALKARAEESEAVAGVIQGNHPVRTYPGPYTPPLRGSDDFSAQRRAALSVPTIKERESLDNVETLPDFEQSEHRRPLNDPLDW